MIKDQGQTIAEISAGGLLSIIRAVQHESRKLQKKVARRLSSVAAVIILDKKMEKI